MHTNLKFISSFQSFQTFLIQSALLCPLSKRNHIHYYIPLTAAFLYILLTSFLYSAPEFESLSFGLNMSNLLVSLAVIKAKRQVIYLFYVLFTPVISLFMISRCREHIFSYLGFAFILPQLTLIGSSSLLIYIIFVLTQIFIFQYQVKSHILDSFRIIETDPFLQNFLSLGVVLYLFFMLSYGTAIHALRTRTHELEQHTKDYIEASEKHKLYLLGFSHELRNPINSLLGNLQLSLQEKVSDEVRNTLQTAKLCGDILLQQVNNMLDSGKLEAGKLEIQLVPTRVHDLSQRVWAIFSELIRRKNLTGCLRVDKNMPTLLSLDPYRINQILLNLIGNAVKFTDKGNINISLHWLENASISNRCFEPLPYNEEDEGIFEKDEKIAMFGSNSRLGLSTSCYLLNHDRKSFGLEEAKFPSREVSGVLKIVVKDTGDGMEENDRKRLFKKFSQVSEKIHHRQMGTGLGLYITDEICNKMGGVVKVYSKKGTGTTFIACIPTHSLPSRSSVQSADLSVLSELQEKKVNVIAAGESVTLLSRYVEEIRGTIAGVANNGYAAYLTYMEAVQKGKKIDVVILEADMPKMDGRLTHQKIRRYEQENGLKPVSIMIVHNAETFKDVESPLLADVKEIRKPLHFEEFCKTVDTLMIESEKKNRGISSSCGSFGTMDKEIKARRLSTD